jgi:hypothetical protein
MITGAAELAVGGAAFMLATGQALVGSHVEHDRPWTPPLKIGTGCKLARSKSEVPTFTNITQIAGARRSGSAAVLPKSDLTGLRELASDAPQPGPFFRGDSQ